jgi:hypothetical protein
MLCVSSAQNPDPRRPTPSPSFWQDIRTSGRPDVLAFEAEFLVKACLAVGLGANDLGPLGRFFGLGAKPW